MAEKLTQEDKEAIQAVNNYARDRENRAVAQQNEVTDAVTFRKHANRAAEIITRAEGLEEKAVSDNQRLIEENASLEKTARTLRADTAKAKELWTAAQQELVAARQELAGLQEKIQAANAHIARGEETRRLLDAQLSKH